MNNLFNIDFSKYGISDFSITELDIPISYDRFLRWANANKAKSLHYLTDDRKNQRSSLKEVFPEFKSAIVFLFPYVKIVDQPLKHKIADYVLSFLGKDYHYQLEVRLKEIGLELKKHMPNMEYKAAIDLFPILEKDLAYRAGLGWFGKNSLLLNKKRGSYFLIGTILTNITKKEWINPTWEDQKLETDHCGSCRACVIACPTGAINESERQLDAEKCISNFTIEEFTSDAFVPNGYSSHSQELFGCDICQYVCPWNDQVKKVSYYSLPNYIQEQNKIISSKILPNNESVEMNEWVDYLLENSLESVEDFLTNLSNRSFKKIFLKTPFKRTGRIGLLKNVKVLIGKLKRKKKDEY